MWRQAEGLGGPHSYLEQGSKRETGKDKED